MLRLDRPLGAREIADLLDIDQHTVARYLRRLARLNLVARSAYHQGYLLLGGRQLILGDSRNVKNARLQPTTTINYIVENQEIEAEVVVDPWLSQEREFPVISKEKAWSIWPSNHLRACAAL